MAVIKHKTGGKRNNERNEPKREPDGPRGGALVSGRCWGPGNSECRHQTGVLRLSALRPSFPESALKWTNPGDPSGMGGTATPRSVFARGFDPAQTGPGSTPRWSRRCPRLSRCFRSKFTTQHPTGIKESARKPDSGPVESCSLRFIPAWPGVRLHSALASSRCVPDCLCIPRDLRLAISSPCNLADDPEPHGISRRSPRRKVVKSKLSWLPERLPP